MEFENNIQNTLREYTHYSQVDAAKYAELIAADPSRFKSRIVSRFKNHLARQKINPNDSNIGLIDFDAIANSLGPSPGINYDIDHIIPVSLFDFNNPDHIKIAFAPENHRWLPRNIHRTRGFKKKVSSNEIEQALKKYGYILNPKTNKIEKAI
jgi:hypothetical protein